MTPDQAREENAYTLGVQAYLWGYPLRFYGELISGPLKAGGTYLNDQVKSRTRVGALGVRVFVNGTTDLPKAREAQNGFFAMPLSAYLRYGLGALLWTGDVDS